MSVPILSASPLQTDTPVALFRVESRVGEYDVSPDGQRFVLKEARHDAATLPITIILNWTALLPE